MTLTAPRGEASAVLAKGELTARLPRTGFDSERLIYSVKVADLAALLRQVPIADPGLEHVFDY